MNPDLEFVAWAEDLDDLDKILKRKCEFLKIKGRDERYQVPFGMPLHRIRSGPNQDTDGDLTGTHLDYAKPEELEDISQSQDIPIQFRMIHMFLREATLTKYYHIPNYDRFKKLVENV